MDYEAYSKSDLSVRQILLLDLERYRNKCRNRWYKRLYRWLRKVLHI